MSLFDHFPFTNGYNLNLDWIISKIRKIETDYNQLNPDSFLRKSGGDVSGPLSFTGDGSINMGGKKLSGVPNATTSSDAMPKGQADSTYLPKAGGTVTGNINMDGNKVTGIPNATQNSDAVPLQQAENTYFKKTGGTMGGDVNMQGHKLTGIPNPTTDVDAVSKAYVDARIGTPEAPGAYLPLAGGTLSGPLNMANSKITGLPLASGNTDALPLIQAQNSFLSKSGGAMSGTLDMAGFNIIRLPNATAPDSPMTKGQADLAYAPSGFGLGDQSAPYPVDNNANNAVRNGWYNILQSTINGPNLSGCMLVCDNILGGCSQILFSDSAEGSILIRHEINNSWGVWEWVNPPMLPDVVYRTSYRFNGKPVYTKFISCGTPATDKTVYVNETTIFAHIGMLNVNTTLPYNMADSQAPDGYWAESRVAGNAIILRCGTPFATTSNVWYEILYWI